MSTKSTAAKLGCTIAAAVALTLTAGCAETGMFGMQTSSHHANTQSPMGYGDQYGRGSYGSGSYRGSKRRVTSCSHGSCKG